MKLNSQKTAVAFTAVAVAASTLFGSYRSLNRERNAVLAVFEQGEFKDGMGVKSDLQRRWDVCANLCAVAARYMPEDSGDLAALRRTLTRMDGGTGSETDRADLVRQAQSVLAQLETAPLSEQDARYVRDFAAELDSISSTISHDAYTQLAHQFNDEILGRFPANVLGAVTGVKKLPIYE